MQSIREGLDAGLPMRAVAKKTGVSVESVRAVRDDPSLAAPNPSSALYAELRAMAHESVAYWREAIAKGTLKPEAIPAGLRTALEGIWRQEQAEREQSPARQPGADVATTLEEIRDLMLASGKQPNVAIQVNAGTPRGGDLPASRGEGEDGSPHPISNPPNPQLTGSQPLDEPDHPQPHTKDTHE